MGAIGFVAGLLGLSVPRLMLFAAVALMLLGGAAAGYALVYNRGADASLAKVEKQNDRAVKIGREARGSVDSCFDSGGVHYDARTGDCERPVPDVHR